MVGAGMDLYQSSRCVAFAQHGGQLLQALSDLRHRELAGFFVGFDA